MISSINSNQSFGSLCAIGIDTSKDIEAVVPYVKAACNQMGKKFNGIRRTGYVEDACRIWSSKPGTVCIDGFCPVVIENKKAVRILDDSKESCEKLFQTLFKILREYNVEFWGKLDRGCMPENPIHLQ